MTVYKILFLVTLIAFAVWWVIGIIFLAELEEKREPQPEWCEVGVSKDGQVVYASDKNKEELWVVVTESGKPLLMKKCSMI